MGKKKKIVCDPLDPENLPFKTLEIAPKEKDKEKDSMNLNSQNSNNVPQKNEHKKPSNQRKQKPSKENNSKKKDHPLTSSKVSIEQKNPSGKNITKNSNQSTKKMTGKQKGTTANGQKSLPSINRPSEHDTRKDLKIENRINKCDDKDLDSNEENDLPIIANYLLTGNINVKGGDFSIQDVKDKKKEKNPPPLNSKKLNKSEKEEKENFQKRDCSLLSPPFPLLEISDKKKAKKKNKAKKKAIATDSHTEKIVNKENEDIKVSTDKVIDQLISWKIDKNPGIVPRDIHKPLSPFQKDENHIRNNPDNKLTGDIFTTLKPNSGSFCSFKTFGIADNDTRKKKKRRQTNRKL